MGTEQMHGASHLISRDGVYYFKRRIPQNLIDELATLPPETLGVMPDALRKFFTGKEFVRFSLKTKQLVQGKQLLASAEIDFNAKQELLEQWLGTSARHFDNPSDEALRSMASIWVDRQLKIDEERRFDPNQALELEHLEKGLYIMEPQYRALLALGGAEKRDDWIEDVVVELQREFSIRLDPKARAIQMLRRELAMGVLKIYDIVKERNRGNLVPLSQPASVGNPTDYSFSVQNTSPKEGVQMLLGDAEKRYLKSLKPNTYTRKIVGAISLFADVIGRDRPVHTIRQREVTDFLHDLCNLPADWVKERKKGVSLESLFAGPKQDEEETGADDVKRMSLSTWSDNYRSPLQTFLTASARDLGDEGFRLLTTDGIRYVGSRLVNEDQQRALSLDELQVLFQGNVFSELADDPERIGMYWLSVMALYTGARPREVCQINPQVDFGKLDDIWYLDINHQSAAGVGVKKTVKTGEIRRIPIHSEAIKLGFVEYTQRIKKEGADRLFPTLRIKSGNPFSASGAEFTQLLMDCNLYDDKAPPGNRVQGIYVLRKTFITEARNQHVISKEITGHSSGMTTEMQDRHYIFGLEPLRKKQEQMEKLKFELSIPRHK